MNYKNPQEGAKLMYETIDKYLREVFLARPSQKLSAQEEENGLHEAFMVSRLAMGGAYVSGAGYMAMIDSHVKSQTGKENPKHLVISGVAGKIVFLLANCVALTVLEKACTGDLVWMQTSLITSCLRRHHNRHHKYKLHHK